MKGIDKFTPLTLAAYEGLTNFYECLLEAGVDPNVQYDVSFSFIFLVSYHITYEDMCMDLKFV
jgi:ankyrin repeat protein